MICSAVLRGSLYTFLCQRPVLWDCRIPDLRRGDTPASTKEACGRAVSNLAPFIQLVSMSWLFSLSFVHVPPGGRVYLSVVVAFGCCCGSEASLLRRITPPRFLVPLSFFSSFSFPLPSASRLPVLLLLFRLVRRQHLFAPDSAATSSSSLFPHKAVMSLR